jgi:uncharacterized protein YhaN
MGKEKFVDRKLVNIRGKLMEEAKDEKRATTQTLSQIESSPDAVRRIQGSAGSSNINDKEWKKAIFQRWDEFKVLKRDVLFKLNSALVSIPDDLAATEKRIENLKTAEAKIKELVSRIESLDDSSWDRHNLASELAAAMKQVENARIESMIISAKFADEQSGGNIKNSNSTSSVIHEIQSLTFAQTFRLGLGFFFSLIIGLILSVLLLSLFNYLTLM